MKRKRPEIHPAAAAPRPSALPRPKPATRAASSRSRRVPAAAPRPGRGRPRSEEAHAALLAAALAEVREVGYDAVTMEGVASRAGVGKSTLYRRWSSKETLIAEAVAAVARGVAVPDTGDTHDDLRALMRSALRMYEDPATGPLLSGLVAAMARSATIAHAVRSGFVAAWRDAMSRVLERGVERGALRRDLDVDLAVDLLAGPLFHRYLMTSGRLDEHLAEQVVEVTLRGLAPDR